MSAVWRLELFGGLRVRGGDRLVERFRTQKTGALLAWLALHPGRPQAREGLVDRLWPALDSSGRNSLSVALSSLRGLLEPPGMAAGTVLGADRQSVWLTAEAITTDVAEFDALLARAARAASPAAALCAWRDAVDLYQGELLEGYREDWLLEEQLRYGSRFVQAVSALVKAASDAGDLPLATTYAQRWVTVEPHSATAHAELMRLYRAAGEPDRAVRQYNELARRLAAEGEEPPEHLRRLRAELAAGAPVAVTAAPPAPVATPSAIAIAGTVALLLVDTTAPEAAAVLGALVQKHGGQPRPVAALSGAVFGRTTDALACALAVARQLGERAAAARLALHTGEIADDGGLNGVGESTARLLLAGHGGQVLCSEEAATLLRRDLDPGVWLTDLGLYRLTPEARPARVFQVDWPEMPQRRFPPLAAAAGQAGNLPASLTRFFGRARELTAVEELLLDQRARLVTLTGPGGTGKTRLALETGRRLLDAFGGAVWFVPLADVWDAALIPGAILAALGCTLPPSRAPLDMLADTLAAATPLLILDNYEQLVTSGAVVVHELLMRVPSARCLVTSRQRLDIGGEREYPVPPLAVPADGDATQSLGGVESVQLFVDRAQAVRPDFQLTEHNSPAVATLCRRLEGLPLAIELAASRAQVLSPNQMLERLGRPLDLLVSRRRDVAERHQTLRAAIDWSYRLLDPDLQRFFAGLSVFAGGWSLEAAEEVGANPLALDDLARLREGSLLVVEPCGEEVRYRLLETLRAFAGDQLGSSGDTAAWQQRHLEFFLRLAEQGQKHLEDGDNEAWLARLDAERENFRRALEFALEAQPEAALRLAGALWRFWMVRGYWSEGHVALDRALEVGTSAAPDLRAKVLARAGHLAYSEGDYSAAQNRLSECLELSRRLDDRPSVGNALNELGKVAWAQGRYDDARRQYEESLGVRRALGAAWGIAASLCNLGGVALAQGDHEAALAYLHESLDLRRELGDKRGLAASLDNLGVACYSTGDLAGAKEHLAASLDLRRELGEPMGVATALNGLGAVLLALGDLATARARYEEALAIQRRLGDRRGAALTLNNLGIIACERGEYATARQLYAESHEAQREIGNRRGMAMALVNLGDVAAALGEFELAQRRYQDGLALNEAIGDERAIVVARCNLAEAELAQGRPLRAHELYAEVLARATEWGDQRLAASAAKGIGDVALAAGDAAAAKSHYRQALEGFFAGDERRSVASCLDALARTFVALGRRDVAGRLLATSDTVRQREGLARRPCEQPAMEAVRAACAGTEPSAELPQAEDVAVARELALAVAEALAA